MKRTPTTTSLLACAAALPLLSGEVLAQCPNDDAFEDNDTCGAAALITTGTTNNLVALGAANVAGIEDDYYVVQGVPDGSAISVDILFSHANGDIDARMWDDAACSNSVDSSGTSSDNELLEDVNNSGGALDYYFRVYPYSFDSDFDCSDYSLVISIVANPCLAPVDDGFEENDTCGAAVSLAAGAQAGLFVSETDADYYAISVAAGDILTVDATYSTVVGGDVDLRLYDDAACSNEVDSDTPTDGTTQVEWTNTTGAAQTMYLLAEVAVGDDCNDYDLNVALVPDPCLQPGADDSFEENDDCASAVPITSGFSQTGLFVSKSDQDYYSFSMADGDTVTIDMLFIDDVSDCDIRLYDDASIGAGVCGGDNGSDYVATSTSTNDNEQIIFTNTTGSTMTYYLRCYAWDSSFNDGDCNTYDLMVDIVGSSPATAMCFGDGTADIGGGPISCPCGNESTLGAGEGCNSSLGFGAVLSASGTNVVSNDDMVFSMIQGRPNQPSLLVQGASLTGIPFKDGVFCTGNPTERLEVVTLDATGAGSTTVSIVTEGNLAPGDVRYYQQWYRDPGGVSPCGSGSNFSQGLMVTWM